MTDAQSQVSGDLVICRRTVGGSSKSEYGTRYYVYEEVAPYKEPPEVSEDEVFEVVMSANEWNSGGMVLPENARRIIRALRADFTISRRVGG